MRINCLIIVGLQLLFMHASIAQDRVYVYNTVKQLSSPAMHGRGPYRDGDIKAAHFLAHEMTKAGILPLWDGYLQSFQFDVNVMDGKVKLKLDKKKLVPGVEFVVHPAQRSIQKQFELVWLPDTVSNVASIYNLLDTTALEGKIVVIPEGVSNAYRYGVQGVPAIIQPEKGNIWWHISTKQLNEGEVRLKISSDILDTDNKFLSLQLESELLTDRASYNVGGYLPGQVQADSMIIFVAHFDHLGQMGSKAMFPGASDNASGTATVLDLARYYAAHPEKAYYTMVFLLVAGEEAGLLGSSHFVENAPFSLEKTRFVINLDMVGTGSEGLSIVNGKAVPTAFQILNQINEQEKLFNKLNLRGPSCNSDHCPFFQKNIPAIFLYTFGPENKHYHNVFDIPAQLPFTAYENLFRLITTFTERIPLQAHFNIESQ